MSTDNTTLGVCDQALTLVEQSARKVIRIFRAETKGFLIPCNDMMAVDSFICEIENARSFISKEIGHLNHQKASDRFTSGYASQLAHVEACTRALIHTLLPFYAAWKHSKKPVRSDWVNRIHSLTEGMKTLHESIIDIYAQQLSAANDAQTLSDLWAGFEEAAYDYIEHYQYANNMHSPQKPCMDDQEIYKRYLACGCKMKTFLATAYMKFSHQECFCLELWILLKDEAAMNPEEEEIFEGNARLRDFCLAALAELPAIIEKRVDTTHISALAFLIHNALRNCQKKMDATKIIRHLIMETRDREGFSRMENMIDGLRRIKLDNNRKISAAMEKIIASPKWKELQAQADSHIRDMFSKPIC